MPFIIARASFVPVSSVIVISYKQVVLPSFMQYDSAIKVFPLGCPKKLICADVETVGVF